MISSQCDELRETADKLDERAKAYVPTGRNVFSPMLRSAADTILELRDDLQRANEAVQDAEHDESMAWDRVRKAEDENVKLRELVRDMWRDGMCKCDERNTCAQCDYHFPDRMRELGVEA
jgi:hypothetical protein